MEELIVRINNLLHITQHQKTNNGHDGIMIGAYQFVPLRYELRYKDFVKKLSHRESTLLQALVENKNATVLRKDILMKLWGDDSFFNSRNLDVYITKLRDYLKEDSSIAIITIKGIGYHFAVG
jgi:DNA-binding response OmpR family regulator